MREMEEMPRDNYKNKNILVDEEEIQNKITSVKEVEENNDISLNVQNEEKLDDNINYLYLSFHQNFLFNIIILLCLLILIILEIIYKDSLFKYSLTYEQNLQNSLSQKSLEFFKLMSLLGGGILIGLGLFFILCYYTLIKTILLCIGLILMVYLHDLMKLIYNDPRPFWLNTILFQGKCETSYGNPSGHSLISFYFFLSFGYYLSKINYIKSNKIYKSIIYFTAFILATLIAFSRLALGVHSLDQVLYGSLIGIIFFIIFTFSFKFYDMPLKHYLKYYRVRNYINICISLLIFLLIIPFILYYLIDVNKDKKKYELVMSKRCSNLEEYKFYSYNCLVESLIILLICGIYLGQFIFWNLILNNKNRLYEDNKNNPNYNKNDDYLTLEESINNWNNQLNNIFKNGITLIKAFCIILIMLIPGLFYILIPGNNTFGTILIFKIGLPLFLIGFLSFGPCLYALINILKG